MLHVVVSLKRLQELIQYLLLSFPALNHIWVLGSIVNVLNVINVQITTAVNINLSESLLNESLSQVVEFSSDRIQELIYVQSAVSVGVEDIKEDRDVFITDANLEVSAGLGELRERDALAEVVVHDEEQLLQANDTTGSSSLDLISEQSHQSWPVNGVS